MRKLLTAVLLGAVVLMGTSAAVPALGGRHGGPIRCVVDMAYGTADHPETWYGPIHGCILEGGTVEFWENFPRENYIVDTTEHFFEKFVITMPGGARISGADAGLWSLVDFRFSAVGAVTRAEGPWRYLRGHFMYERGVTSDPEVTWPVTGYGTVFIIW